MTLRNPLAAAVVVVAALAVGAWLLIHSAPPRVDVGSLAPDFTATDIRTGRQVSLRRDYRGTVTLVNVWATYCIPCRQEMPAMDSLFHDLGPRGFRIAAVSVDPTSVDVVRKFVADHHISFDVLHDPQQNIQPIYQTTGVPESFLVDRTGHIIRIAQLAAPWNSPENHRIIEQLLAAPAS
jgi:cytochrome c biogenesis protein CcmG, thiol:disulfide interchange protein DsbE